MKAAIQQQQRIRNIVTKKRYEEILNEQYSKLTVQEVFNELEYLSHRGSSYYITEERLRIEITNGTAGSLLREFDPETFNGKYKQYIA